MVADAIRPVKLMGSGLCYRSRAMKRINDVNALRASQFTEDGGPLAHPVRCRLMHCVGTRSCPSLVHACGRDGGETGWGAGSGDVTGTSS